MSIRQTRSVAIEVVTQVCVPPIFPPEHRVLLFAPEFGTDQSFDVATWKQGEPCRFVFTKALVLPKADSPCFPSGLVELFGARRLCRSLSGLVPGAD